jgi:hypothetical protein
VSRARGFEFGGASGRLAVKCVAVEIQHGFQVLELRFREQERGCLSFVVARVQNLKLCGRVESFYRHCCYGFCNARLASREPVLGAGRALLHAQVRVLVPEHLLEVLKAKFADHRLGTPGVNDCLVTPDVGVQAVFFVHVVVLVSGVCWSQANVFLSRGREA